MTALSPTRTAPFETIPFTLISKASDAVARLIRMPRVQVPGLAKHNGGKPVLVDGTVYTVEEIGYDWVGVHVDHDYDSDLHYFGNHTLSEGTLRDLMPDAFPLPWYPASKREAATSLRKILGQYDLGGWVIESDMRSSKTVYVQPPKNIWNDQEDLDRYFAILHEYLPFYAEARWVTRESMAMIRIRPFTERTPA